MYKQVVGFLFCMLAVVRSGIIDFEDCNIITSSNYKLLTVDIEGCYSLPCKLYADTEVAVVATFSTTEKLKQLTHQTEWIFTFARSPAKITPGICDASKNCPEWSGAPNNAKFSATLDVDFYTPRERGQLSWISKNDSNIQVLCFKIPVNIK